MGQCVGLGVAVPCPPGVSVLWGVDVLVGVLLGVLVGVFDGRGVADAPAGVWLGVGVFVGVLVRVLVGVLLGVFVALGVGVELPPPAAAQKPPSRVYVPPLILPASGWPIVPPRVKLPPVLNVPPPPSMVAHERSNP